ncbi:TetR/AcrR family transcriptional regulator [Streptomyces sp. NPDC020731]|uniref:TetR/AcrR family transcriptional regulator n=1 Tax=Streptomyces sp. NPDC020731 TaxID=3365085 RepID=UPI0037AEBE4D
MSDSEEDAGHRAPSRRKDARRNEETLLDAAAAVFVTSGVDAPVRDIAAEAGVGPDTIHRHFPTRADLIVVVHRHQVDACAEPGPALPAAGATPHAALGEWVGLFVDFLVTKHGLTAVLHSDEAGFDALRAYFSENPCIGAERDPRYDARRLVELLVTGLRPPRHRLPGR